MLGSPLGNRLPLAFTVWELGLAQKLAFWRPYRLGTGEGVRNGRSGPLPCESKYDARKWKGRRNERSWALKVIMETAFEIKTVSCLCFGTWAACFLP